MSYDTNPGRAILATALVLPVEIQQLILSRWIDPLVESTNYATSLREGLLSALRLLEAREALEVYEDILYSTAERCSVRLYK